MGKRKVHILYGRDFENVGLARSYAISQSNKLEGIFYLVEQEETFYVDKNDQIGQFDTLIEKYKNGSII